MNENAKVVEDYQETPERIMFKMIRKERNQIKKEKKRLERQHEVERKKLELIQSPRDNRVRMISREFAKKIIEPYKSSTYGCRNLQLTSNEFPSLGEIGHKPMSLNFTEDISYNNFETAGDANEPNVSRANELIYSGHNKIGISRPNLANISVPMSINFSEDMNCNNFGNEVETNKVNVPRSNELNVIKEIVENKSKRVNFGPVTVNIVDLLQKPKRRRGARGRRNKKVCVTNSAVDSSAIVKKKRVRTRRRKEEQYDGNIVDSSQTEHTVIVKKKRVRTRRRKEEQYDGNILDSSQPERKRGKHREIPKEKKASKLKQLVQKELETLNSETISIKPSTDLQTTRVNSSSVGQFHLHYSNNIITDELNNAVRSFLSNIVRFQENMYQRDPIKGVAKRRYVAGFREVKKYLLLKKVKILIVAPNINADLPNGILDNTIQDMVSLAAISEIPYVFALSRRIIGKITLKKVPVSALAILNYDGTQNEFQKVIELLQVTRDEYQEAQPKQVNPQDTLTNEIIDNFLNFI